MIDLRQKSLRWLPAIVFGCLFVALFANVLFQPNVLSFRDPTQFYARQFQFIQNEWAAGRIPLWNPHSNCGEPIVGNGTSSVFYPGKLIFFLPIPFWYSFNLYVMMHVVMAAAASYWLARKWRINRAGATICALSYAFCGNVLFQCSNVIYLVSAAWLPLALLATDRMLRQRSIGAAIGLGAVLALMVLGGEPQTAYHAGLMAMIYALVCRKMSRDESNENANGTGRWSIRIQATLLAIAALCSLLLSAIQVFPSVEWSRQSIRGRHILPQSIYGIPGHFLSEPRFDQYTEHNWYDELLGKQVSPPPVRFRCMYSVGPWRAIEMVWPWSSGCDLSQNQRWIHRFYLDRDWVPSMYMGILPLLLAIRTWKFRHQDLRIRWISIMLVVSIVCSLGRFAPGWLWQTTFGQSDNAVVGESFGGLYWFLVLMLPGYDSFRWPAKWLVISGLCASLLAGFGWNRIFDDKKPWLRNGLIAIGAVSLLGIFATSLGAAVWKRWLTELPDLVELGPFDSDGARSDVLFSFVFTLVVCAASVAVLHLIPRRRTAVLSWTIVILVAIDLGAANGWMIVSIPAKQLSEPGDLGAAIKHNEAHNGNAETRPPFRLFRGAIVHEPQDWSRRFAEASDWGRCSLLPMHHLTENIDLVSDGRATMMNYDYSLLLNTRRMDLSTGEVVSDELPRRLYEALNAKYLALPKFDGPAGDARSQWREISLGSNSNNFELLYRPDYFPRAWIVHDVIVIPTIAPRNYKVLDEVSREIGYASDMIADLRHTAVVESDRVQEGRWRWPAQSPDEFCQITNYQPQRVEIKVRLESPGFVVLSDVYEKNWIATEKINGVVKSLEIHRTNRAMRGVKLDPGIHRVVFQYAPSSFFIGAWVSGLAWLVLISFAAFCIVKPRRNL